jgi:hypothetical protein
VLPVADPKPAELAQTYSFRTTEELIDNLSDLASWAAKDLTTARITRGGSPSVARTARVFNDSIHQLRLALCSRDELQSSSGHSYSAMEVAYMCAQVFTTIRDISQGEFLRLLVTEYETHSLTDPRDRALLEEVIQDAVKCAAFPALSETGAYTASLMLENRHLSTLRDRQRLFYEVMHAWRERDNLDEVHHEGRGRKLPTRDHVDSSRRCVLSI